MSELEPAWPVKCETCGRIADPETRRIRHRVTMPVPDDEQLEQWAFGDGDCEATDGCSIEIDGTCEHGHRSWLLELGLA